MTIQLGFLNSHLHLNGGMRVVVADLKVLCAEVIDTLHFSQDLQRGEGADLPLKLQIQTDEACVSLKSSRQQGDEETSLL